MRKIFIELIVSVALLLGTWMILSQVDWMKLFNIEQTTKSTEEKVGDLFWDLLKKSETEITSTSAVSVVDSMVTFVCEKNAIDRSQIKVHLLRKDEINAFALPNHHLVVYSGLINACENQQELYGVLCHEIAHMEKNHVMNKLVKEIGLSMLISISTGNGNSEVIRNGLKQLSSSAYDRKLETEADLTAVDYLIKAGIDPQPFANFLYRLADETKNLPTQIYWISTHPESKARAEEIIHEALKYPDFKPSKTDSVQFITLKEKLQENN
ncbi:MAG: M48 family metallopeptidase [Candidatus Saccharibacteria bacterium]